LVINYLYIYLLIRKLLNDENSKFSSEEKKYYFYINYIII